MDAEIKVPFVENDNGNNNNDNNNNNNIYKAPFLSRAHSALQIFLTSTIHNAQATIASNQV